MLIDLNVLSYNFTAYTTPVYRQLDSDHMILCQPTNNGYSQVLFRDSGVISSYVVTESLNDIYSATFDLIKADVVSRNNLPVSGTRLFNVNISRIDGDRVYILKDAYGCSAIYPPTVSAAVPDADYGEVTVSSGGTVWTLNNGIDPSKITQDSTHRFVTDVEKSTWNAKQDALGYTPAPESRELTINGVTYDLSANRSWTVSSGLTHPQILARTLGS